MVPADGPFAGVHVDPATTSYDVIVVAAGGSSRMEGVDKRAALIGDRPLLAWTLSAVARAKGVGRLVLVMEEGPALEAVRPFLPSALAVIVPGGPHRAASVAAGVSALARLDGDALDPDRVVLVHDGARPLVDPGLVAVVAAAVAEHGAAVPVVELADTVRRIGDGGLGELLDRAGLAAAQTPQGARIGLLQAAFRLFPVDGAERFTDEAALLTACTIRVHPVPGDPLNLKVTLPADLTHARLLLAPAPERRAGHATDWHPFGPGEPLRLGGIEIAGAPRLHGHSDGDVALHAVADALLGAAGLADLGTAFPADARTPRGIAGRDLLGDVVQRVAEAGWRPVVVDLAIDGARPRLAGHIDAMRLAVAGVLAIGVEAVTVKASTGNLSGDSGAGRGIGATALVTVERLGPGRAAGTVA